MFLRVIDHREGMELRNVTLPLCLCPMRDHVRCLVKRSVFRPLRVDQGVRPTHSYGRPAGDVHHLRLYGVRHLIHFSGQGLMRSFPGIFPFPTKRPNFSFVCGMWVVGVPIAHPNLFLFRQVNLRVTHPVDDTIPFRQADFTVQVLQRTLRNTRFRCDLIILPNVPKIRRRTYRFHGNFFPSKHVSQDVCHGRTQGRSRSVPIRS